MGNILLNRGNHPKGGGNSVADQINRIKAQGPSNLIFEKMYQSNPNFRQFANSVRNMTPEEAFSQYGLDFNMFRNQRW